MTYSHEAIAALTDADIADAREDGTLDTWRITDIDGQWIVYCETRNGVAAYACSWDGMTAVSTSVEGLVCTTAAKTYSTKSAAVAAVRRTEGKYRDVAVRGEFVFIY